MNRVVGSNDVFVGALVGAGCSWRPRCQPNADRLLCPCACVMLVLLPSGPNMTRRSPLGMSRLNLVVFYCASFPYLYIYIYHTLQHLARASQVVDWFCRERAGRCGQARPGCCRNSFRRSTRSRMRCCFWSSGWPDSIRSWIEEHSFVDRTFRTVLL